MENYGIPMTSVATEKGKTMSDLIERSEVLKQLRTSTDCGADMWKGADDE